MANKSLSPATSIITLLEHAANTTAEGITISDMSLADNPLIYLNDGFEKLTGYTGF